MSKGSHRLAVAGGVAALGVAAAGATARLVVHRKVRARRDALAGDHDLGSLRSEPVWVETNDGIHLHAEVDEPDGPSDEPTVVFVHGYALNLDCWHFQRAHFAGRRRTVFYDQRSHGRSERSPAGNATIDQLGHDLRSVLDALVPEGPVILVGHSMGGMTIMALAHHHPELFGERVVGVGLVSTSAGGLRSHAMLPPLLPDRVMSQITPRLVAGLARLPKAVDSTRRAGSDIGFLATEAFAFGTDVPDSYVEFVDVMLAQTPFEVIAEFFPNFDTHDKFTALRAFERTATVIVCGTKDLLTSIGHSRKMAALIDGAHLVECLDAGHMVIMERADQVNAALDRMVADADRRGTASRAS